MKTLLPLALVAGLLLPAILLAQGAPPRDRASAGGGGIGAVLDAADGAYAIMYFPGTINADEAQPVPVGVGQEAMATFALISANMSRISGVVRSSQGVPIGHMLVSLSTRSGAGPSLSGGTTQNDGSFTILNVPPGEYFLLVGPMGRAGTVMGPTSAADEFASAPLTTTGGDITGLVVTTAPGAIISGRVAFEGVPEAPPELMQSFGVVAGSSDPIVGFAGMGAADEGGLFQIRGVRGRIVLRAASIKGPNAGWFLKSVTLNGVDITDTGFDAEPSTTTTGFEVTMTNQQTTVSGVVRDARGDPLKDFVVAVFPAAAREAAVAVRATRTIRPDQQGRYETKGLPPGDYVAVAVGSLEQGGEWDPAFQQQMRPRGQAFRLTDGQSLALDLPLVR